MLKKISGLQINFALLAFGCFAVKLLVTDASVADSIVCAVFGGVYGYTQYLGRFKPHNLDEIVAKELLELRTIVSRLHTIKAAENLTQKKYF